MERRQLDLIVAKVALTGRVTLETINQISQLGHPIADWLAVQFEITSDGVSSMVLRGEVREHDLRTCLNVNLPWQIYLGAFHGKIR